MPVISLPFFRRAAPATPRPQPLPVLKTYVQPLPRWAVALTALGLVALVIICGIYGFFYAATPPILLKEFIAPLIPLACLVIWVLPASNRVPERAMAGFFWAIYVSTMLWPNYLAIALPGLPWISAVRLTGMPMALLLLVGVSQSQLFRKAIADSVRAVPFLMEFQVAFVVIQVLSIVFSDHKIESINIVVDNLVGWTAVFFVSAWLFLKPGTVSRWAWLMCWSCVLLCFIGLWEQRLEHPVWAGHIPPIFQIQDEYVQRVLAGSRRLGMDYRVQGAQSTSLGFAEHLALATPFFLHYILGDGYKMITRLGAALALPLLFWIILATQARLGMVGFMLSNILYVGFWAVKRWRNFAGSILGPAVLAAYPALFCFFITASFFVGRIKRMVWGSGKTKDSDMARIEQLNLGIPKVLSHPWGYGTGRGADELGYSGPSGIITIDNYFLNVALDWGVIGFIVYYGMLLMVIFGGAKRIFLSRLRTREHNYLIPVVISLTVFFVIKTIFSQTHNHKLQFMMMGMACALIYRIRFGVPGDELPHSKAHGSGAK